MTVRIKYTDHGHEHFTQISGEDIEVDLLVDNGIDIEPIPPEEWSQGFRAKERECELA